MEYPLTYKDISGKAEWTRSEEYVTNKYSFYLIIRYYEIETEMW